MFSANKKSSTHIINTYDLNTIFSSLALLHSDSSSVEVEAEVEIQTQTDIALSRSTPKETIYDSDPSLSTEVLQTNTPPTRDIRHSLDSIFLTYY